MRKGKLKSFIRRITKLINKTFTNNNIPTEKTDCETLSCLQISTANAIKQLHETNDPIDVETTYNMFKSIFSLGRKMTPPSYSRKAFEGYDEYMLRDFRDIQDYGFDSILPQDAMKHFLKYGRSAFRPYEVTDSNQPYQNHKYALTPKFNVPYEDADVKDWYEFLLNVAVCRRLKLFYHNHQMAKTVMRTVVDFPRMIRNLFLVISEPLHPFYKGHDCGDILYIFESIKKVHRDNLIFKKIKKKHNLPYYRITDSYVYFYENPRLLMRPRICRKRIEEPKKKDKRNKLGSSYEINGFSPIRYNIGEIPQVEQNIIRNILYNFLENPSCDDLIEKIFVDFRKNNIKFKPIKYIAFAKYKHPPLAFYHLIEHICTLKFPDGINYKESIRSVNRKHIERLLTNQIIDYKKFTPIKLLRIAVHFNRVFNRVNFVFFRKFEEHFRNVNPNTYYLMINALPLLMSKEFKHYLRFMLRIIVHLGRYDATRKNRNGYYLQMFFENWSISKCPKSFRNQNEVLIMELLMLDTHSIAL